ncbi:hypothetical protein JSY36_07050 [Bacillus sp. H-16]|uniref:hypothetical protein n=1 Tax=Alteribacter salitolerans TaxID=2912333 RepID=UPI00196623D1|nr:hypothetical protein [Alteribacter salitolerans]MBM7095504.1 hypothetical protein [Alteribacter salitolerans]
MMAGPFTDKYVRYVLSWLLFGLFGFTYLLQFSWSLAFGSVLVGGVLTFGIDYVCRQIVKMKTNSLVDEKPQCMVDAFRHGKDKRGYLVLTENYLLFVPVLGKVRTVFHASQIVRRDVDGLTAEFTAKLRHQYRRFTFSILTKQKFKEAFEEATNPSLPYKGKMLK